MCAHAVRVAVQKLEGVTRAVVSLEEGRVTVDLDRDNDITLAAIRNAIRNQGFSPRAADVRVSGRLEGSGDSLVLRMPGSTPPYAVVATGEVIERLRAAIGRSVVLSGTVPGDEDAGDPTAIHVTAIESS